MKVKLTTALKNLKGEKLYKEKIEDDKVVNTKDELQLKDVCVNALMTRVEGKDVDGIEKMKRYLLATKIQKANELDLKSEEITKIKELIGEIYSVLIVGQAYEMLEK